jgi:hypothetical protein
MQSWGAAFVCGALLVSPIAASAQGPQTRAGLLEEMRREKAANLDPPRQSGLERALILLENDRLLERLLNPAEGIYPKIGTVTPGGGFALGPAYRRPELLGGHADLSAFAAGSFKRYWMLDARLNFPRLADDRVFAELLVQRFDFPSEDYFGLGPVSDRRAHVTYGLQSTVLGAGGGVRPVDWFTLGGRLDYLTPRISGGTNGRPIERLFDEATAPGLAAQPDFVRYEAIADLNYRQPQGNPRRGGRYALVFQHYDDRETGVFSFDRLEADVQQYFPMLNDRRVIAVRAFTSLASAADGRAVPFYFQRTLGGPDDLRGFRRFRFRDENMLLLQAEYRWEIFTAVDGAIFYDAGKVAPSAGDLNLDDLESDYGIGFRFGTKNGVFLRIEGAFGSDAGKHLVFRFGHVF